MGQFIKTTYNDTINNLAQGVKNRLDNNFYKFNDKKPTQVTFYNPSEDKTTFDEATCKGLIGTEFPGKISKIKTEPYQYTIRETGEVVSLEHRYMYLPDDVESEEEKMAKQLEEAFV